MADAAVEESAFPAGEAGEESTIPPREDEDEADSTRDLLGIDGEDKTPKA